MTQTTPAAIIDLPKPLVFISSPYEDCGGFIDPHGSHGAISGQKPLGRILRLHPYHTRAGLGDDLIMTQELIADNLGLRGEGITVAADVCKIAERLATFAGT